MRCADDQNVHVGWELVVAEIGGELVEVAGRVLGVRDVMEEPVGFLGVPGVGDLPAGVTGA